MFDNVLNQNVTNLIMEDISRGTLPQAMLFSGPEGSGKLTCAIELARILSCAGDAIGQKGEWLCTCPSCLKHKALMHGSLLLMGSRECTLEIDAAKKTLLGAVETNATYIQATRYLFIRSVRKLTLRFSPVLWEGDEKLTKMAPLVENIDELLEELEPQRPMPVLEELRKITDCIVAACKKLENTFLYDLIPVAQIRRAASWAHLTTTDNSQKVVIIENADRMQDSVRNALLKILEEPPTDVTFILTTSRRGAVMPTILSRVRTYPFVERNTEQQQEVIQRVFHDKTNASSVKRYLESFLPVSRVKLAELACSYLLTVQNIPPLIRRIIMQRFNPRDAIPVEMIIGEANNFEPKLLFTLFLKEVLDILRIAVREKGITAQEQNAVLAWLNVVRRVGDSVSLYNQSIAAVLEYFSVELAKAAAEQ